MKKSIKTIMSIVLVLFLFSCGNNVAIKDDLTNVREVSFADEVSALKDELIFYSMTEAYKISEESIENDISSFLALKTGKIREENSLSSARSVAVTKNTYDLQKVKTFKKEISSNALLNKETLGTRSIEVTDEINFSIYDISNKETGTKGIAITSDDERIGSLLCVLDNIDCTDETEDPVLEIFLERLDSYVEKVSNELESITEEDLEYFKEKYGITEEEIEQAKLEYEKSILERKFWGYDSWSSWSVNDINLNHLSAKTKWGQRAPYNDAVVAMEGGNYPTGCGATAVAQIMAYHSWPESYTRSDLATLKSKWSLASSWDGKYDWVAMTANPDADYLSVLGKVCVGALMYDVSKGIGSTYKEVGTESYITKIVSYLRTVYYNCDNYKNYSFDDIKNSLSKDCPVLTLGQKTNSKGGHYWVIDGSLQLIRSRNYYAFWIPFKSSEYQNYVHCNYGWSGYCDNGTAYTYKGEGYYKSGVFETEVGDYSNDLYICTNIKPNK